MDLGDIPMVVYKSEGAWKSSCLRFTDSIGPYIQERWHNEKGVSVYVARRYPVTGYIHSIGRCGMSSII